MIIKKEINKISELIEDFYKYAAVDVIGEIRNYTEQVFPNEVWAKFMESNPPPEGGGQVGGKFIFELKPGNVPVVTGSVHGTGNLDAWAKKAFAAFGGTNKLKALFIEWAKMHKTEAPFRDVATTETDFS